MDYEMKHIDAEKLKAEIDKRYAEYRAKMKTEDFTYYEGMADALDLFEQFLDSLQQEQPSEDLEEAAEKYVTDWTTCYAYEIEQAFIAGAKWQNEQIMKEQPEVDLEKASRNVYESWMGGTMNEVRRDMVELGKVLNARKEDKK